MQEGNLSKILKVRNNTGNTGTATVANNNTHYNNHHYNKQNVPSH